MAATGQATSEKRERASKGLKADAIGFVDALVIGLASTAPAYSLAAVIGLIVLDAGVQAPAILLASFVPMFFIAAAFYWMDRADPDCGTTFSWVTRTLGPWTGWMGGWAITMTGVLVVGSLADVAARYGFLLVGWDAAADSKWTVIAVATVLIGVMTWVCVVGAEAGARLQRVLIFGQVLGLLLFAGVALVKVWAGGAPPASVHPQVSWLSPFAVDSFSVLTMGMLTGVFIYWGWESAVNLTEETRGSDSGSSGRAGVLSTVILLVTYLVTTVACVAYAGPQLLTRFADDEAIFSTLAGDVLGSPLDKLVVLAILASALASTQTTILPASRTTLSMARSDALPAAFGRVHPRFQTPHVSTIAIGVVAALWYVGVSAFSENFLFDTLTALALMIAFYYALTGVACVIHYRRELRRSVRNLLFMGVGPAIGAVVLGYLWVKATIDYADPETSATGSAIFGIGLATVIGIGFLLLGFALLVVWRLGGHPQFFSRERFEAVEPRSVSESG
ncbi:APC family permease [Conexibacter sp. JD483]|uniref:APC family permease n=1 Tax=unclassified Conexibacter TaxID=2627773 RepID=UPI00271B73CB|nr:MULTISPECIES: APC family permease [unclassified Conexibacter]MDO8186484.1 APC family permease [Conexibacter sp. CPCC 205706]MDO8200053.1 APC family permease [Conexibacter sp. CPCC 205762]MDR9372279.1 APC family permease [Conexibacter sp. JD483]